MASCPRCGDTNRSILSLHCLSCHYRWNHFFQCDAKTIVGFQCQNYRKYGRFCRTHFDRRDQVELAESAYGKVAL